jgi:hypothetical protein
MNHGLKPRGVLLGSIITTWACLAACSVIAADRAVHQPGYDEVGDPSLPRVLLIGDSISMGYTPGVRALLADQVNVHRPAANCGATFIGLRDLDKWLNGKTWDIIHFNFGVHDLHAVIAARKSTLQSRDHIHCNAAGSRVLAEQVANVIEEKLAE